VVCRVRGGHRRTAANRLSRTNRKSTLTSSAALGHHRAALSVPTVVCRAGGHLRSLLDPGLVEQSAAHGRPSNTTARCGVRLYLEQRLRDLVCVSPRPLVDAHFCFWAWSRRMGGSRRHFPRWASSYSPHDLRAACQGRLKMHPAAPVENAPSFGCGEGSWREAVGRVEGILAGAPLDGGQVVLAAGGVGRASSWWFLRR
jgi:hypothetical protein